MTVNSPVGVCNLALSHLRQRRIQSITSPTSETEAELALWYPVTRRALLREYVWRFAKARTLITRVGTPAFDWASEYKLPVNFIRLLSVGGDNERYQTDRYDMEGTSLLTKGTEPSIKLRYIKDVEAVTEWDPLFVVLMSYRLAVKIAYQFTLKQGLMDRIEKQGAIEEAKAATVNSQERPPIRIEKSHYLRARSDAGEGSYYTGPITDFGE